MHNSKYLVLGIIFLLLVGIFAGNANAGDLPAITFVPEIVEKNWCPDLAANYLEHIEAIFRMEEDAKGLGIKVWVAKMNGDPLTLFDATKWPIGTTNSVDTINVGELLNNSIQFLEGYYSEIWGSEWVNQAKQKAIEWNNLTIASKTYEAAILPYTMYSVSVMSPYIDVKTLKIYEGTYVSIIEITLSEDFLYGIGEAEDDLVINPQVTEFSADSMLGEWELNADEEVVKIFINDYIGNKEIEGYNNMFYSGEIHLYDQVISVTSIPNTTYSSESYIRVEDMDGYYSLGIYIHDQTRFLTFFLESMTPILHDEIGAIVAFSNLHRSYETENTLDYLIKKK